MTERCIRSQLAEHVARLHGYRLLSDLKFGQYRRSVIKPKALRGLRKRALTFSYWKSSVDKQKVNKYVTLKRLLGL
jgi:hypothetical protein